jgi:hypothetical protein
MIDVISDVLNTAAPWLIGIALGKLEALLSFDPLRTGQANGSRADMSTR